MFQPHYIFDKKVAANYCNFSKVIRDNEVHGCSCFRKKRVKWEKMQLYQLQPEKLLF